MFVACLMFRCKSKGCLTVAPYSNHSLGSILITQKRTISQEKLAVTNTLAYFAPAISDKEIGCYGEENFFNDND
jgi:hypothetical protein